jgi:hypothetical protein
VGDDDNGDAEVDSSARLGFSASEICLGIYIVDVAFFWALCRKRVRGFLRDKAGLRNFVPVTLACALFAVAVNLLNVKGLELAPQRGLDSPPLSRARRCG